MRIKRRTRGDRRNTHILSPAASEFCVLLHQSSCCTMSNDPSGRKLCF